MRRAKIVATIGPASRSADTIRNLLLAGVNVARLNFSHGSHEEHLETLHQLRSISGELGIPLAILQDLQGVKIRTGRLAGGEPIALTAGQELTVTTRSVLGDVKTISTSYSNLPCDVRPGDRILLSDGLLELSVKAIEGPDIRTQVITGGKLAENQGINLPGTVVSAPALTEKDLSDLEFGVRAGVDLIALSFVRTAENLIRLREHISALGAGTPIIAKIEKPEAIENLEEIIGACQGVMVARGDLGVEMSPERVPVIQKQVVQKAREMNRVTIIATQMLDSMIRHPLPTRAEASDVANAVFDGADALMLSGETAVGTFPVDAVKMMRKIIEQAEREPLRIQIPERMFSESLEVPAAVCRAANHAAKAIEAKAIIAFSQSAFTANLMSSFRPETPVIAFSPHCSVVHRMNLLWGVSPKLMREIRSIDELIDELERILINEDLVERGDKVVIICGAPIVQQGITNLMKLHEIGDSRRSSGSS
ncbi:MAG: pyruvate kinase [Acidobacteriota bacterium]|nr:MAG: pyruvate kinase [Acidobacteriota bacterium]